MLILVDTVDSFAARQCFSVKGLAATPLSDGQGPEAMKAKAEIVGFLKESFAFGHKAVATLTPANSVEAVAKNKRTRLFLATFALLHPDSSTPGELMLNV